MAKEEYKVNSDSLTQPFLWVTLSFNGTVN